LNTTQQIGGSIGLAVLTTVSSTVIANSLSAATHPLTAHAAVAATVDGWTSAFKVSAGLAALAFVITLVAIKVDSSEIVESTPRAVAA
jgi:hypothetical protein